jgi:hypothetical protein
MWGSLDDDNESFASFRALHLVLKVDITGRNEWRISKVRRVMAEDETLCRTSACQAIICRCEWCCRALNAADMFDFSRHPLLYRRQKFLHQSGASLLSLMGRKWKRNYQQRDYLDLVHVEDRCGTSSASPFFFFHACSQSRGRLFSLSFNPFSPSIFEKY